mmetsp:Transcript_11624/g.34816  ORF Transcript_11624/g.34816 Transcript_11624/m.34816 type:complete len:412 (-) Transcript_11624:2530-3765(-)
MAAMLLNIAGATAIEDPEYRYKMPRLIGKVEGRGNGIKTAVPNMTQVASSLHRGPGEVTKFFGCELGAQTTWTEDTERAIVNGAHSTQVLQDKLSVYIEKFVLCPSCKLPETNYKIKNDVIYHQCVACGAREPVDMQHKLTTYILKCHKLDKKKDKKNSSKKVDEKKKKSSSKAKTDADKAEKKRKKKEKKRASEDDDRHEDVKHEDGTHTLEDDDDEDPTNKSEESEESEEAGDFEDDASAMQSAVAGLKAKLEDADATPADVVGEAVAVQKFCALPRNERAYVLLAALFYEKSPLEPPTKRAVAVLAALRADVGPSGLICGLEKVAKLANLSTKFAILLKHLYDADVLDEAHVLKWHANGLDNADTTNDVSDSLSSADRAVLLRAAAPFVTWLQQADEEDDDDDEEDDD